MSVPANELRCAMDYYVSRMNTSEGVDEYLLNVFSKLRGGMEAETACRVALLEAGGDE